MVACPAGNAASDLVTPHPASGVTKKRRIVDVSDRYPRDVRGTSDASSETMLLEVIFQYRTLIGKCELGLGLEFDEIEQVTHIESVFAPTADDRRMKHGRRFRREAVKLSAVMRGDRIHDRVEVVELGPGGLVVRNAPYVARGEQIELMIEAGDTHYRFRARGVWLRDDGDDYRIGLALVGMPVCLHRVALSEHQADVVDKIAAAA